MDMLVKELYMLYDGEMLDDILQIPRPMPIMHGGQDVARG